MNIPNNRWGNIVLPCLLFLLAAIGCIGVVWDIYHSKDGMPSNVGTYFAGLGLSASVIFKICFHIVHRRDQSNRQAATRTSSSGTTET